MPGDNTTPSALASIRNGEINFSIFRKMNVEMCSLVYEWFRSEGGAGLELLKRKEWKIVRDFKCQTIFEDTSKVPIINDLAE